MLALCSVFNETLAGSVISKLHAFFMIIFLLFGVAFSIPAAHQAVLSVATPTYESVIKGKWTAALEPKLTESLAFYGPSRDFWGLVDYVLFREGRKGVLVGTNGWLFTDEEFAVWPNSQAQIENHLKTIEDIHKKLKNKDIPLIVALLPAKARLYPEYLGKNKWPIAHARTYGTALDFLHTKSIPAPNLLDAFSRHPDKDRFFLKTDTHWAPDGARLAAQALASALPVSLPEKSGFKTRRTGETDHSGDLMRYIPQGNIKIPGAPEPDKIGVFETQKGNSGDADTNALFGEQTLPVALVGTSYSANDSWNFAGFLKEALHSDVLNAADEGRGPFVTMIDYLESPAFRETPPDLVIWEIPERYLAMPEKEQQKGKEED